MHKITFSMYIIKPVYKALTSELPKAENPPLDLSA